MIDNRAVGPPISGLPGGPALKESAKSPREDASGSFSRTLGDRLEGKTSKVPRDGVPEGRKKESDAEVPKEAKVELTAPPGTRKTGAREKAIREFMDSFESEFGIPPTRIVEAMASIEPQKITKSPEATAQDVIQGLDLDEGDRDKAMAMYAGLLAQLRTLEPAAAPAAFAESTASMSSPAMQARLLQSLEHRSAMNQSVDALNSKFWMTGAQPPERNFMAKNGPGLETASLSRATFEDSEDDGDSLAELGASSEMELAPPHGFEDDLAGRAPDVAPGPNDRPILQAKASPEEMKKVLGEMKRVADQARIEKELQKTSTLTPAAMASWSASKMAAPKAATEALPAMNAMNVSDAAPLTNAMNAAASSSSAFTGEDSGHGSSDSSSSKEGSPKGNGAGLKAASGFSAAAAAGGAVPLKMEDVAAALKNMPAPLGTAVLPSSADHETNVRQILNQAQYLIKKGGGEVKVEMSPEGLGSMQLKVLVKDGKVNVQVAAETSEAKKAIESSLPELRSSLAAHKLSVDHVKVDVVGGVNTENQTRNETQQQNPQGGRDPRQFWNNFQENFGNRSGREGLWDLPDTKAYRQTRRPDPLAPVSTAKAESVKRADGRGSGIDLVA